MSLNYLYTNIIIGLLLKQNDEYYLDQVMQTEFQWDRLLQVASENKVVIRLFEQLNNLRIKPGDIYHDFAIREKERIARTIELMSRIHMICQSEGVDYVFMKNYQHFPDMGDDIDILVLNHGEIVGAILEERFSAKACNLSFHNRFAGKSQYYVDDNSIDVEIHHGRIGVLGEHNQYPKLVLDNREMVNLINSSVFAPCHNDQFVLQLLQRVYGRFSLRISELIYTCTSIRDGNLDFRYIENVAQEIGVSDGLCYYLSYINSLSKNILHESLPLHKNSIIVQNKEPEIIFVPPFYRFPILSIVGKLFFKKLLIDIGEMNWLGVGRVSLIPIYLAFASSRMFLQRSLGIRE